MAITKIDKSQLMRSSRKHTLALLEEANLVPDRLIAHRDRTYTAKYRRKRMDEFGSSMEYEARLELLDSRIAILKRPSKKVDRGPYITFKFTLVDFKKIGITAPVRLVPKKPKAAPKSPDTIIARLSSISSDMGNLTKYAHDMARNNYSHEQLMIALEEIQNQITTLDDGIGELQDAVKSDDDK